MNAINLFLHHESCPQCRSRDNLGRWADGHAWCFGCHYYEPPKILRSLAKARDFTSYYGNNLQFPPEDSCEQIGAIGWTWLKKYGIMESEVKDCLWSDSKQWLIFPIYSQAARRELQKNYLIAWQARNFNKIRPKPKYVTHGPISDIVHIIGSGDTIVLVEDILSAIKVGRSPGVAAMPLWGSTIALKTLTRLVGRFKQLGIWLDMDKAQESLKSKLRASQLRFDKVFSILTPLDPKEYSDINIKNYLDAETEIVATKLYVPYGMCVADTSKKCEGALGYACCNN